MNFYHTLEILCGIKGTSISSLLDSVGLSRGNISKWKDGRIPKLSTRSVLAEKLGASIEQLLTDEELNAYKKLEKGGGLKHEKKEHAS